MNTLTIQFDFVCPSGWKWKQRSGWKALMGYNKKFDKFLSGYGLVKRYHAKEKRKVEVIRYAPKRRFIKDYCNLVEAHKPLFDALVRAKLLVDDSIKWVDECYKQEIGEEKTLVTITWR